VTAREFTFAMIDLAGYTALTEHHGDLHAADLAVAFANLVRGSLREDDRLIKTIGDAVLLAAESPHKGIELVERVLKALDTLDRAPLTRTGLHHGEAVERDGDLFGTAVNIAARVAAHAQGGQVLATKGVAEAARQAGIPVMPQGSAAFKNLSEQYELFDLALAPARELGSVDPVCRMWIPRSKATGPEQFDGRDYWFCSTDCAELFAAEPQRYLG
jgi:class 3 adenylate cyclase/YHS domain-containing protein